MVTSKLQKTHQVDTLIGNIRKRLAPFLVEQAMEHIEPALLAELTDFDDVLRAEYSSQEAVDRVADFVAALEAGWEDPSHPVRQKIMGVLVKFKGPGKLIINKAVATVGESKEVLQKARRLKAQEKILADVLAKEQLELEDFKVVTEAAKAVNGIDVCVGENTDLFDGLTGSLEFGIALDKAAVALGAWAIGVWARRYAESEEWTKPNSDMDESNKVMMYLASEPLSGQVADGSLCAKVDKEAVDVCAMWYSRQAALVKAISEPVSMSSQATASPKPASKQQSALCHIAFTRKPRHADRSHFSDVAVWGRRVREISRCAS